MKGRLQRQYQRQIPGYEVREWRSRSLIEAGLTASRRVTSSTSPFRAASCKGIASTGGGAFALRPIVSRYDTPTRSAIVELVCASLLLLCLHCDQRRAIKLSAVCLQGLKLSTITKKALSTAGRLSQSSVLGKLLRVEDSYRWSGGPPKGCILKITRTESVLGGSLFGPLSTKPRAQCRKLESSAVIGGEKQISLGAFH